MIGCTALLAGFLLDLLLGDPQGLYHPICAIGRLIAFLEKRLRALFPPTKRGEHIAGLLEVTLVCLCCFFIPFGLLFGAFSIHFYLGMALEIFWCWQLLATRSLRDAGRQVYAPLAAGDLPGARKAVSGIVGRDTKSLSETGVIKATVETIAENTSDGVIAPLFYMAIGGVPLMFLYKGINTMDSMLGYQNDKYLHFGRYAAKLDDIANYLPSRIAAYLMIAAAALLGMDAKNAANIHRRDRRSHASPNSAQTESVMAGALGVQLAGNAFYFGKLYEKPTIGDAGREISPEDIGRANRLLYGTAFLGLLASLGLHVLLWL